MNKILQTILLLFSLTICSQSSIDSLVLTYNIKCKTDLNSLRLKKEVLNNWGVKFEITWFSDNRGYEKRNKIDEETNKELIKIRGVNWKDIVDFKILLMSKDWNLDLDRYSDVLELESFYMRTDIPPSWTFRIEKDDSFEFESTAWCTSFQNEFGELSRKYLVSVIEGICRFKDNTINFIEDGKEHIYEYELVSDSCILFTRKEN
ncbi:MAG: hypothetical protein HRT66_02000 [Flavobacteriaceae bacterium]|nr:hypothetical protein [Flavobacteriaceae bacterium]